jgi:hypothetical protein
MIPTIGDSPPYAKPDAWLAIESRSISVTE